MINANLLPPEIKQDIAQSKANSKAIKYVWLISLILVIVLLIAGGLWYSFNSSLGTTSAELQTKQEATKKYGTLEEKAKKLAERIATIKKIDNKTNHWSGVISEIQAVMPTGLYLNSVRIDSSPKIRAQISGTAKSKQEVATLRDSMEKSPLFEYVDIESSTTEKDPKTAADVENFTISFALSPGALK
jgi:Tfp pilus assembly protein PilN